MLGFWGRGGEIIRKWKRGLFGHCCEDVDVTLLAKQILYFLPTPLSLPHHEYRLVSGNMDDMDE